MRKLLFILTVFWIFGCASMIYIFDYNAQVTENDRNFVWLEEYGIDFSKPIAFGYRIKLDKVLPLDKISSPVIYLKDLNLTGQQAVNIFTQSLLYGALAILLFFLLEPLIKKAIIIAILCGVVCIFLLEYTKVSGLIDNFRWINFITSSSFFSGFALLCSLLSKAKRQE